MLRPKKKITRKEMKEDALVTWYVKVTGFYEKYKKAISIGITATVVVIIASVVYVKNRAENSERAFQQLGEIHTYFDNGQYQVAIDGAPERNLPGLLSIVDNYGGTTGGNLARFYLASAYYQLGKIDEALEQFEGFSPDDEFLEASRYAGIGACYEAKQDYSEAADYFEKASAIPGSENAVAEQLNNAARTALLAGEKDRALELYKRLKRNYPTTTFGRDADRFITQLSI